MRNARELFEFAIELFEIAPKKVKKSANSVVVYQKLVNINKVKNSCPPQKGQHRIQSGH